MLSGVGAVWGMVWNALSDRGTHRRLSDQEQADLASATMPVLAKYAPMMEKYAEECALGLVLIGVFYQTTIPPELRKKSAPKPDPAAPPPAAPPADTGTAAA